MLSHLLIALLAQQASAVRLLLQNDLSASTDLTSALLLDDSRSSGTEASSACSAYNEQLLPSVDTDIQDQLNYLVFRGDLSNSSRIYIGGSNGAAAASAAPALRFARRQAQQCQAYDVGSANVTSVDCTTELVRRHS